MRKWKYYLLFFINLLMFIPKVNAEEILFFEVNPYYRARVEGSTEFQELTILTISDNIAYSLDPIKMPTQVIYEKNNDRLSNIKEISYLEKIAYFGYDKENPNEKMYMAAQELIWEYISNVDVYWTDYNDLNILVEDEKNKILENINKIDEIPTFDINKVTGNYFDKVELYDTNNVLDDFKIINNSTNLIKKEKNRLEITIRENSKISLEKNINNNIDTTVYSAINSTDIITLGINENIRLDLEIETTDVPSAYLEFQFLNNEQLLNGSVEFEINGKMYKTNEKGYFLLNDLYDVGTYNIKILKVPNNYQIIKKEFTINILEKNINNIRIIKIEESLSEKLGMFNLYRAGLKEEELPLSDVNYKLYAYQDIYDVNKQLKYKKDEEILSLKTDINGIVKFENLNFGKYYLKEASENDYEKSKDIVFEINSDEQNIYQKIITNHKSVKIMIVGDEKLDYFLYNNNGEEICKLKVMEENVLPLEYNNYYIKVKNNEKNIYTWNISYSKDKSEFIFYTKDYLETIIFDMPKTGNKCSFNIGIIAILLILIKKMK